MAWYLDSPEGFELPEGYGEGRRADERLIFDALHEYMHDAEQDAATVAAHFAAWEAQMQGVAS